MQDGPSYDILSLGVFCPQCRNDVARYLGGKRGGGQGVRFWGSLFTHSLADSSHISKSLRVIIDSFVNHNMGKFPYSQKVKGANIRLIFTLHIQSV